MKTEQKKKRGWQKGMVAHNRRPVVHDGVRYESVQEMADAFNTWPSLIRYYLREDKPFCGAYIDYEI